MRFLHTSDWHLGRSFHQVGLLPAQARVLDHLVEVVRAERVDAVLVAGDVYDRALPSPDAVHLLSETVVRVVDAGAQVVLSSGNHDSATRLGFASDLLERSGLHIRSTVADIGRPVLVKGVAVHALPYLEPSAVAETLGAQERTHAGVLRAAMSRVAADLTARPGPSVVMAHAFVTGGATSDSERDIAVGGVSAVHPDVFAAASYAALGHLHGRQEITERVRYSGSPVAMSFSEWRHTKGSWLVDLADDGAVSAQFAEAPVDRPLRLLRGDLDDLLVDPSLREAESSYVQATLTDPTRPRAAMDRLRARFPHTLVLQWEPQGVAVDLSSYAARVGTRRDDLDLCCDFLTHVRAGHPASRGERGLLREALEASRVEQARHADEMGAMLPGLEDLEVPEQHGRRSGAA
ncbi:exonuclease SbcCD subunit D C-terminal domain-containing protein [Dermatophilaceae bacterium Soc4.6]